MYFAVCLPVSFVFSQGRRSHLSGLRLRRRLGGAVRPGGGGLAVAGLPAAQGLGGQRSRKRLARRAEPGRFGEMFSGDGGQAPLFAEGGGVQSPLLGLLFFFSDSLVFFSSGGGGPSPPFLGGYPGYVEGIIVCGLQVV